MFSLRTLSLLLIAAVSVFSFSCVSQKKVAVIKRDLSVADSQLLQYDKSLSELEAKKKTKQEHNAIDDTASAHIQRFIDNTKTEISQLHGENTILIGNTEVNKADWDRLRKGLSNSRHSSKNINDKILLLTDLINRNMVIDLDQDVIFQPGKYIVSKEVAGAIGKFFEPAAKEIDMFTQKYPDFPLSLVITTKGYADGTSIVEGSQLYKDLSESLKLSGKTPDSKDLNKELSVKRAMAVKELFENYTKDRSVKGGTVKNVLYLYEGKGEAFPNPTITDYKVDDPRRRVVLLFWSIFPE